MHKWTLHILWWMYIQSVCISPYQQRIVVGWPQGCVLWRGLLLSEHTQGNLLIAIGLARGRNGWDIWLMKQPQTFSLQPLRRQNDMGKEVRVCDGMGALAYKVAEHCLWPWEGQRESRREGKRRKKEGMIEDKFRNTNHKQAVCVRACVQFDE